MHSTGDTQSPQVRILPHPTVMGVGGISARLQESEISGLEQGKRGGVLDAG